MTRNTFWKMMLHDSRVITSTLTIFQASRWGVNDFHESRVEKNGSNVLEKKRITLSNHFWIENIFFFPLFSLISLVILKKSFRNKKISHLRPLSKD